MTAIWANLELRFSSNRNCATRPISSTGSEDGSGTGAIALADWPKFAERATKSEKVISPVPSKSPSAQPPADPNPADNARKSGKVTIPSRFVTNEGICQCQVCGIEVAVSVPITFTPTGVECDVILEFPSHEHERHIVGVKGSVKVRIAKRCLGEFLNPFDTISCVSLLAQRGESAILSIVGGPELAKLQRAAICESKCSNWIV